MTEGGGEDAKGMCRMRKSGASFVLLVSIKIEMTMYVSTLEEMQVRTSVLFLLLSITEDVSQSPW